jgi:sec-independent protein translocase protein TatB
MLDVGFSEILLTSAIALIVLGPERLPKVARQVGNWVGRARVMARQLSEQLEREVNAEELLKAQKKTSAAALDPVPTPTIAPPPAESPRPTESLTSAESPRPAESQTPAASLASAESPAPAEAPPPAHPPEPIYGLAASATTPAAMHASDPPVTERTAATAPQPPHE